LLEDLIAAVGEMRTYIERAQRQDANAVERAVAYLDAAQAGIEALGQTAQRLHNAATNFDPAGSRAEDNAQDLLARVTEYLHTNVLTAELDGIERGLRKISDQLKEGNRKSLRLPRTRRRQAEAVSELQATLDGVLGLLDEIAGLTRHIPAGTGIGAPTLRQIEETLASAAWRDQPSQAKKNLSDAVHQFRASDENARWLQLSSRLPELKQGLLGAFPPP
jgi:hypothetical protein